MLGRVREMGGSERNSVGSEKKSTARRAAEAGFLFFLIKGLLWLIAPGIAWWLTA